jgi:hypothetical protein
MIPDGNIYCQSELTFALLLLLLLVCRYDDDSSCSISGWSAHSQLDCLIDQQVQSAVARAIAGKPCAALQHLAVNMETMMQQAYPDGWFARVAAALKLAPDQRAVLRAVWGKAAADRASLLKQHEMLTKQLLMLQQQQAARVQQFEEGLLQVSQRCIATMQQHAWQNVKALCMPGASAAAAGGNQTVSACQTIPSAAGYSLNSSKMNNNSSSTVLAGAVTNIHSSAPAAGGGSSCSGSSSRTASTASAAAAAAAGGCCNATRLMDALASFKLQEPAGAMKNIPAAASAPAGTAAAAAGGTAFLSEMLSMTCSVRGPEAAAAAAAADSSLLGLACHPEVLLCEPRSGQQQLQQKLAAVRGSLGVLHTWCSLVCYNTLSRKQLAVAAVNSYPFAFDPMAGEQCGPARSVNFTASWWGVTS